jgi:6-phosphogluconolactonase (cycloisomerase 2 family)
VIRRAAPLVTCLGSLLAGAALLAQPARDPVATRSRIAPVEQSCGTAGRIGFLYVNEGTSDRTLESADNAVSGYAVHTDGCLEPLPQAPWPTGGRSRGGAALIAAPSLAVAARADRLYVLNRGTSDVSVFRIEAEGNLVPLDGSPFPTGGGVPEGIALSPDGRFLFVADSGDRRLATFGLDADGAPHPAAAFDLDAVANGLVVTGDNRFVVAALPHLARIAVLAIATDGSLRHAPGSPLRADLNGADGVALSPGSGDVYVSAGDIDRLAISRYRLQPDGRLDRIPASNAFAAGGAGNILAMMPDGRTLVASQTNDDTATVFRVDAHGALSPAASSPFPTGEGSRAPTGLAFDPLGRFLFVVHASDSTVTAFTHLGDGNFALGGRSGSGLKGLPLAGLVFVPEGDQDGDGIPGPGDNCGAVPNPSQGDADGDGRGDACDVCPSEPDAGQRDSDRDGVGDRCDPDRDGDGVPDVQDRCADVPDEAQTDGDGDGAGDACDNCPAVSNPGQEDADRDREGDACARPFVLIGRLYVQADSPDNAIAGWDVDTLGRLRRIHGSPFLTGGEGPPGSTLFSPPRLAWTALLPSFLFSTNEGSDDLSVMRIAADGGLSLASGRVRGTGGTRPAGVALRPHSLQLAIGHIGSQNVALAQVQESNGAVFGISGGILATNGRPAGMSFSSDGRFLEVAMPDLGAARTLKADPPFFFLPSSGIGDSNGRPAGLVFNKRGDRVYLASSTSGPSIVSAWVYGDDGLPTRMPRSPQTAGGLNSNVLLMHPRWRYLYVSQQGTNTIGVLRLEPSGALAPAGDPFPPARFAAQPVGMAADPAGRFLFASYTQSNTAAAYRITASFGLETLGEAEKTGAPAGRPLAGVVFVPAGDEDDDGIEALADNCPSVANAGQADGDGDGDGDACDPCPHDPGDNGDSDGDGLGDDCDADRDGDGVGDGVDLCPADGDADQTDTDADGFGDRCDRCRTDPFNDADADGSCADIDDCPAVYNPFQENSDADHHGDACDNCPLLWNDDQADIDRASGGDACQRGFQQTGFLFVNADLSTNRLAVFETKSTGRLLPGSGSPYVTLGAGSETGQGPALAPSVALARRGPFLFALNFHSRDITVFRLGADGLPRAVPGTPFPVGLDHPIGLVSDNAARFVWVAARDSPGGRLKAFDVALSGRLSPRADGETLLADEPDGLAMSPDDAWIAVSFPAAGRIALFAARDGALLPVPGAPGGPLRFDGVIPGIPRPGPLLFAPDAGRLLLDVGAAPDPSDDHASAVAVIDVLSGALLRTPFGLGSAGGIAALARAEEGAAGGADLLYAALPGDNGVAVVRGLHREGPVELVGGAPFALPAPSRDPVGLSASGGWLHVVSREANTLATFRIGADDRLEAPPIPPTSTGAFGGRPAPGAVWFDMIDRDGDGFGPLADNCPATANPGQEDRDGDHAGDACQPSLLLGAVTPALYVPPERDPASDPPSGTALAVAITLTDPQQDPLSGRVTIAARRSIPATLLDAAAGDPSAPIDCGRVLRPAAAIGGGVAYVNGSVGDAALFDQDLLLACDDGVPDYELAEGACGTPGLSFTELLILNLRTPPFDVCVRPKADRAAEFDLRLEDIALDHLDLTGEVETAVVDRPWAGRRPDPIPLEALDGSGPDFTLALTATDGGTPSLHARAPLRRGSEAALVFGAAPVPSGPADRQAECAGPDGTRVALDGTGAFDPDGDAIEWIWIESAGTEARLLATGPLPEVALSSGEHSLTLLVVDATGLAARHDFHVTVSDTEPPAILRLDASPATLWPPDHRLVPVHVVLEAKDACSGAAHARMADVTSSEPEDAAGDGRSMGDIVVRSSENGADLLLRAERKGGGPGRVYRVRFVVADEAGHAREATIDITVPASGPGGDSSTR